MGANDLRHLTEGRYAPFSVSLEEVKPGYRGRVVVLFFCAHSQSELRVDWFF